MNIFLLDTNLERCAQYHCDKHIVKMPIEYAQILSVVARENGFENSYAESHKNHPCTRWAAKHGGNYAWLYQLALAVGKEYTYRYGKLHKSTAFIMEQLPATLGRDDDNQRSPLPNCTTWKADNPHLNLVDKYRMYYIRDKAHILSWKNREEPPFMGERFYRQQIEAIGNCPGNSKNKLKEEKAKKPTKAELAEELGLPCLEKLTLKDLQLLQNNFVCKDVVLTTPTGRLKKPFVEELAKVQSQVAWSKLTVAELKEVITHYGS